VCVFDTLVIESVGLSGSGYASVPKTIWPYSCSTEELDTDESISRYWSRGGRLTAVALHAALSPDHDNDHWLLATRTLISRNDRFMPRRTS